MTVKQIKDRILKIAAVTNDDEKAHSMEKDLWYDVLHAIACGNATAECAKEALETTKLEFSRWFA